MATAIAAASWTEYRLSAFVDNKPLKAAKVLALGRGILARIILVGSSDDLCQELVFMVRRRGLQAALSMGMYAQEPHDESIVKVRRLQQRDSIDELTALLHRAYAPLAAQGLRYVASHQSARVTRNRIKRGECFVVFDAGRIVGTVTLIPPGKGQGISHYAQPDVASFHQFAVDPAHQGRGLGAQLLDLIERRAVQLGARELAFDTSEHAAELIAFYEKRGFRFIEHCRWKSVNYRSVVMSKRLSSSQYPMNAARPG